MQFAVLLPQFGAMARGADVGDRIAQVATAADRLGYDVLWTAEHVIFPPKIATPYPYGGSFPYPVTDPILDVVSTLSYVAAVTTRIRLGSAVMVLPYHHPIVLAKALATLDVLSRGRLLLGIAGGWLVEEFDLLGVPFRERGARTDEYLDLLRALWTEERVTFDGRWFQLTDAAFFPKPVQRPHPPIWIGGSSPAVFRRIARAGDGWIAVPRNLDALAADIGTIRKLTADAGRDPAIGIASSGGATSMEDLIERLPALERLGVTVVTVPLLHWARDFAGGLALLDTFAARVRLGS